MICYSPDDLVAKDHDNGIQVQAFVDSVGVDPVTHGDGSVMTSHAAMFQVLVTESSLPLVISGVSSGYEGEFLPSLCPAFTTPRCAGIEPLPIFDDCISGDCTCELTIGAVTSQLKPCRAAQILFGPTALASVTESDRDYLWKGLNRGFDIVDSDCPSSYFCENYDSILEESIREEKSQLLQREIEEGKVSIVDSPPRCVHSLGAVRKANGSLRPITDCSRPEGGSINNFMSSTFHSFAYNSVQDAVDMLSPNDHMAVVDISSAYRAVNVSSEHAKFQGLCWDFGQGPVFLQDNR